MEDNRVDVTRQRTIILIVGFICFAFVIVALSFIIGYFTSDDPKVAISNEKTVQKSEDTSINGHDYSMIKKQLRTLLSQRYNLDENEEINAVIRESTYEEYGEENNKTISFTIDVENVKVTYNVWMVQNAKEPSEVSISCTSAKDAKYPETFCIGTEGHSSIDTNLASELPYRKIVDGEEVYNVRHEVYDPKLILSVFAKCDDDAAKESAKEDVKKWISTFKLDPEQVPIEYKKEACKIYEDSLKEKEHEKHTQEDMQNHKYLFSTVAAQDASDSTEENLDIQSGCPVLDIINIQ